MASCKSIASQTGLYWRQHKTELELVSKANPEATAAFKAAEAADKMIRQWNSFFGKGRLAIGPRELKLGKAEKGAVTGPTQRMFLTERPTLRAATVRVKKTDGRMKTSVTICTYGSGNRHRLVKSFQSDSKDKDGKTWTAKIPAGCMVSVLISGRVGLNKFQYEVGIKESASTSGARLKTA